MIDCFECWDIGHYQKHCLRLQDRVQQHSQAIIPMYVPIAPSQLAIVGGQLARSGAQPARDKGQLVRGRPRGRGRLVGLSPIVMHLPGRPKGSLLMRLSHVLS